MAVVVTVLAVALRSFVATSLGDQVPFVTFFFAVVVAAWLGGVGPTILTVVLSAAAASYLFLQPRGWLFPADAGGWTALGLFLAFGGATAAISGWIKHRNEQIQRERNSFSVTLSSIGDGVIATDTHRRITFMNAVAEELTGWSKDEAYLQPVESVFQIVDESTGEAPESPVEKALRESRAIQLPSRTLLVAKNGQERPIEDSAAPIRDGEGLVSGVILIFRDGTARRQAELAEREHRRLLELRLDVSLALAADQTIQASLQQCTEALVQHLDMAFARIWILDAAEQTLQLQASAGLYTHLDGAHGRIRIGEYKIGRIAQDRQPLLTNDVINDPNISDPQWAKQEGMKGFAGYPLMLGDQVLGVLAMFSRNSISEHVLQDLKPFADAIAQVVDRKQQEERLRLSDAERKRQREWLSGTLSSIGDAVIATDTDGRITFLNRVAEKLTGWSQAEAAGKPLKQVFQIINESTRQPVGNPVDKVLAEGIIVGLANHTILIAKDGNECPIDDSAAPIRDEHDAIIGVVLVFRDVTEQKKAERRIAERETQYRNIFESTSDAILIFDYDGRLLEVNPAACTMHGYRRDELLGKNGVELVHPDDHHKFAGFIEQVKRGDTFHVDGKHIHKDGTPISTKVTGSAFVFAGRPALLAVLRDVTEEHRAIDALKESEARLRFTLEATQIGQWDLDLVTGQAHRTPRHDQIFGYDPPRADWSYDIFLNQHVHPDDRARVDAQFQQAQAGGKNWNFECRIIRADGQTRWIWVAGSVYYTDQDRPLRMAGLVMDVSDRKQIELREREHEQQFRALVEQIKDYAIFMTDPNGRPTSWNEGVRRVLGMEEDEFLQQDFASRTYTVQDLQDEVPQNELREAADTGTAVSERWMRKGDGTEFFALGVTTCLVDDQEEPLGFIKVLRDQTERKRMEDELRCVADDLAEADRRKDEFLAMLAHELRNPLAPIRSGLDLLAMEDPPQNQDVITLMQEQVEHVVRLVDDLLDVSRIMRGKVELRSQTVELATLVNRSVDAIRSTVAAHHHDLQVSLPEQPIWLNADPVRIVQVLENLLNNAAKYMEPGGRMELSGELRDGQAVVQVKDQGIGIERDLLPNVFELFTQSTRSLDRSQGGLGIGLTLVQRLVQMHGGTVTADSPGVGCGSTFTVTLPVTESPPPIEVPALPAPDHIARRIVIVDDNQGAAWLLSKLLSKLGDHEIQTAHDGPSALKLVLETHPEIVLLDIGLPGMDGLEVARAIRANPAYDDILLIALTGYGQDEDRLKSKAAGFDEHSVKPPSIDHMKAVLSHEKLTSTPKIG